MNVIPKNTLVLCYTGLGCVIERVQYWERESYRTAYKGFIRFVYKDAMHKQLEDGNFKISSKVFVL